MAASPTDPLSYRVASAPDAPKLAALINAAFRSERTGQTWLFDDQARRIDIVSSADIAALITSPDSVVLVGSRPETPLPTAAPVSTTAPDQEPLTSVFLRRPSDPPREWMTPGAAWFGLLAVRPGLQGVGRGAEVLGEMERFAREEWGVGRVEMDFVSARTGLRAWYERCGYAVTGARREFEYGERGREILAPGLELIVMGKDLGETS